MKYCGPITRSHCLSNRAATGSIPEGCARARGGQQMRERAGSAGGGGEGVRRRGSGRIRQQKNQIKLRKTDDENIYTENLRKTVARIFAKCSSTRAHQTAQCVCAKSRATRKCPAPCRRKNRTVVRIMALDPRLRGFESRGRRPGARWKANAKKIAERLGSFM